ncbi:MAG: M14 family metallopeptidase, partial [bacterium]|nr:M14 family metallopeptidase [bacterium]
MPLRPRVPALPFRQFFSFQDVTEFLSKLASAHPNLCKLQSLGKSREGREIHLLVVTDFKTGAPEDRPAYLLHGNIHAGELAGTHAALYTARQLLIDHSRSNLLSRVTFYIVPRLNPDGAEHVVTTSGRIRSRTDWNNRPPNTLCQEDVNNDGLILTMRQKHPDGAFVVDPKDTRLLIRRQTTSKGPFYRVMPEGIIHDWDGTDRVFSEGRAFDWNRNWSFDWRPEPEQPGAGDFPFSEPEMRHLAEFLHSRPNLFGVLGYHTGPAAVLRPPSTGSLSDLDESDERQIEDLARIGEKETGFPVIPVIKYHGTRNRDINLRGHFHNFGYQHLGLYVYEFELGTIKDSAGISTQEQFTVENDEEYEAQMRRLMKWWDRLKSRSPLFKPWKRFQHPQLG